MGEYASKGWRLVSHRCSALILSAVIKYDITLDLLIPSRYCDNERVCASQDGCRMYERQRQLRPSNPSASSNRSPQHVFVPCSGGHRRGVARFGQNIPAAAPPRAEPRTCYIYIYIYML